MRRISRRRAVCQHADRPGRAFRESSAMRHAFASFIAGTVVLVAPAISAAQIPYSYTLVASNGGASTFAGLFAPTINSTGTAAFGATLINGGAGVFAGSGGA